MNTHRRSHQYPNVRSYMTPAPHTIGRGQSLTVARPLMHEHGIRHLPVLDGGTLVGLLSERDVFLVESLPGTNPTEVRAEEAMVPAATCAPTSALYRKMSRSETMPTTALSRSTGRWRTPDDSSSCAARARPAAAPYSCLSSEYAAATARRLAGAQRS